MTTLRAATLGGGMQRRGEQSRLLRRLLEGTIPGGFLLPRDYVGCEVHEWVCLDSGYAVCKCCGGEHWCCHGTCPEAISDQHERVCLISGCVTLEYELRAERDAITRVGPSSSSHGSSSDTLQQPQPPQPGGGKKKRRPPPPSPPAAKRRRGTPVSPMVVVAFPKVSDLLRSGALESEALRDLVENTVREILVSEKTSRCMEQERQRNEAKELATFSRMLREVAHDRQCQRPNMAVLVGQVRYHCRKNRKAETLLEAFGAAGAERTIRQCTEAITRLFLVHGGPRVARQIQNTARNREFIVSMLYLIRAGVSFQGRQVLPRMELLHHVLPLQVLLPQVFQIRAKSITEGENLIKLDLKSLPIA